MTDTDGYIGGPVSALSEKVCGLLFDISAQENIWTTGAGKTLAPQLKDKVLELNSIDDAVTLGLNAYTGESTEGESNDFLAGIPYYHIQSFFRMSGGTGRLFVYFADCKTNWDAIVDMQKAAHGEISQFGVWTEQNLWRLPSSSAESYVMNLVPEINAVAVKMANDYHAPASIILTANTATVVNGSNKDAEIVWSKIPKCTNLSSRYVTVLLGQAQDDVIAAMQGSLASTTPVGVVGFALGTLTQANVGNSIGWVEQFDLGAYIPGIEFGFGDATISDGKITSATAYESLTVAQLEELDNKGYVFMTRYTGLDGQVFFSGDGTCTDGDYRTISRNRAINKSRRAIRTALLPYVNSPIKVDPSNGQISTAAVTIFTNLITDILTNMVNNSEISAIGVVNVPVNQNILQNDALHLSYSIVPLGVAKQIFVEEHLAVNRQ